MSDLDRLDEFYDALGAALGDEDYVVLDVWEADLLDGHDAARGPGRRVHTIENGCEADWGWLAVRSVQRLERLAALLPADSIVIRNEERLLAKTRAALYWHRFLRLDAEIGGPL